MAEERRVVTILFADVAGSTALGETLDPEDARLLLRRYYDIARETVGEYGGILEKFIGDAVVAVFGFPQTHDDDPQRALSAALVLRDRVRADAALNDRLPIRIGINTGEVVASRESATGDFPLTGDAVNVAARLQSSAEPWGILCGERTVVSSRNAFEFGPRLNVEARGKSQPVGAYELLGRATRRTVKSHTSLVGRDADLQQLELAARRALHEARPFLVSIIAPAGVGKTRLLEEFLERLPAIAPGATVAIAQCLPYGQRLTYWPLRAVLYRLIDVPDDAKPKTVRSAIRAWLEGSGLEAMDREIELLAATVGAGEAEVTDRSALVAAWRTFFEIAARRQPLVLVFEDLHWSSDSLLDLFEYVMQPRGDLPLLMIALTRPELLDRRPAWGGGRRNYVSISLEPLSNEDTARLVQQLLEGCSTEMVQRVVQRAEGNPFFAGELVRSISERPDGNLLPDTVQATVLSRLDLLAAQERRLIQLASVFGRSFRLAGLRALEPQLADSAAAVEQLVEKDLLRPASAGDTYTFRHILIREVAYQTLTRSERARLHGAAAAWMETVSGEREHALAEMIAYHYREAALILIGQRPNEGDTERIRAKAVDWIARAAEVAASAAASVEGSRHLRSAIELAKPARLPELYERLGDMAESGDLMVDAYQTALRLNRDQRRPPEQELQILAKLLTQYMRFQGSVSNRLPEEALFELRQQAAKLAAGVKDERTIASYLAAEGFLPFWLRSTRTPTASEVELASGRALKALDIARGLDDFKLQSIALDALTGTTQEQQQWRGSREFARQRLGFQDRLAVDEKIDAYAMVVWASSMLGDLEAAERVSAEGLAQVLPGQYPAWALHLVAQRTYTLTLLGRWDEALAIAEHGRQLWYETGRSSTGYATFGFIAAMDVARARQDQNLQELYAEVIEGILAKFPEGSSAQRWRAFLSLDLTAVQTAVEQPGELGLHRVERGLNLLLDHDRWPNIEVLVPMLETAHTRGLAIIEAQIQRAIGRARHEVDRLSESIELLERAGALPYAARVHCERALITGDHGEMESGIAVLERLGDLQQLARFERLKVG